MKPRIFSALGILAATACALIFSGCAKVGESPVIPGKGPMPRDYREAATAWREAGFQVDSSDPEQLIVTRVLSDGRKNTEGMPLTGEERRYGFLNGKWDGSLQERQAFATSPAAR